MSAPPEANFLIVTGRLSVLQKIVDAWPRLVNADGLRDTPVLMILPIPDELLAQMIPDPLRIGRIGHAPGVGQALLDHLVRECQSQLRLTAGEDFFIERGYYATIV